MLMKRSWLPPALMLVLVPLAWAQGYPEPPIDSEPVLRFLELRFPTQGNQPFHRPATYLGQAETVGYLSIPGRPDYTRYTDVEAVILADAQRFWGSGDFFAVWVDVVDSRFENGVLGKRVVFNFVERRDTRLPTEEHPTVPPEFREPPPGHIRLYPPP
jgi:hypothetical protein